MSKNRLKKGFTIIELIVVIAILGILVLLALPKFLGYTEKAKVAQVKSDIVAYEKAIDAKRIDKDKYIKDWEKVDVPTMESLKKSLFNKKGLISSKNEVSFGGEYYKIPKDNELVKTNLKGDFYLGQSGEVYYYDENLASKISGDENSSNNGENDGSSDGDGNGGGNDGENGQPPVTEPDPPVTEPDPPVTEPDPPAAKEFTVTFKDYYGDLIEAKKVEKGQAVDPPKNPVTGLEIEKWDKDLTNIQSDLEVKAVASGPTDKDLGYSDTDFLWYRLIYGGGQIGLYGESGYFYYYGEGRSTVEIPHVIQGVPITSYYKMFKEAPTEVNKVISTNRNVTDMSYMFFIFNDTSLDLTELDTSNVKDMSGMFHSSRAGSIKFGRKFNTSKVENMSNMFDGSHATSLDLRTFNTSNVKDMSYMFNASRATSLDLSSFNTSKVENMKYMFDGSQATSLDLSSFDTSNVSEYNINFMFNYSQATEGYARTKADADKFNNSVFKAPHLTFVVKTP